MGMGFAPTWLRQVSPPLLHKTTLSTECDNANYVCGEIDAYIAPRKI